MSAELDALFDRTKSLAAKPRTVSELSGGLTNRNYKVTTPDGTFVARISSGRQRAAGDRPGLRVPELGDRGRGRRRGAGRRVPPPGSPAGHRLPRGPHARPRRRGRGRQHRADRAGVPPPALGRAVRQRLRHVRHPAAVPVGGAVPRLPRPGRIRRPGAALRCRAEGPGRPRRDRPSRATTTCWPRTSSTTGTGSGWSTTSCPATTTPASSSATSRPSLSCPPTPWPSSSRPITPGRGGA